MTSEQSGNEIRTRPCPDCYLCGAQGKPLYQSLKDRLFGSPGEWNLKKCPNPECGLVWLDPMPLLEDISKAYETYYTHGEEELAESLLHVSQPSPLVRLFPLRLRKYLKHGFFASAYGYPEGIRGFQRLAGFGLYLYPFLARTLARAVGYVPYLAGGRLLDVGCGDGSYLDYMRSLGWEVEGVEVDPRAVEQAGKRNLRVHSGTLEQQGFEDCRFDTIVLSHVLEHVHDPAALLRECHRILKPGGIIKVFVPNLESVGHRRFKASWLGLDPPRHLHLFTIRALRKLALEASLDVTLRTSSAMARGIYMTSVALASENNRRGQVTDPLPIVFKAYLFDVYEAFGVLFAKEWGEEIVLHGKKR